MSYTRLLWITQFLLCIYAEVSLFREQSFKNKRNLQPDVSCDERYDADFLGDYIESTCCSGENFVFLTQNDTNPIVTVSNRTNIIGALKIDHTNRSGVKMQGIQIRHWFNGAQHAYVIASIKTKSDSSEYPCITKYNSDSNSVEFTTCVDTPLIGNYDKTSNLNFAISNFVHSTDSTPFVFAIRSQTYNGVMLISTDSSNGTFTGASLIKDPTAGDPIDGQILFHSVNKDKNSIGAIRVTSTSDSTYDGQIIVYNVGASVNYVFKLPQNDGTYAFTYLTMASHILSESEITTYTIGFAAEKISDSSRKTLYLRMELAPSAIVAFATKLYPHVPYNNFLKVTNDDNDFTYGYLQDSNGDYTFNQIRGDTAENQNFIRLKRSDFTDILGKISRNPSDKDWLFIFNGTKLTAVRHSWSAHPLNCLKGNSELVSITTENYTLTIDNLTNFVLEDKTSDLSSLSTEHNDSSSSVSFTDFQEADCGMTRNNASDIALTYNVIKANTSSYEQNIKNVFGASYNYSCILDESIGVSLSSLTLNQTVLFQNGSTVSWADADDVSGNMSITNVPVSFSETQVNLTVLANLSSTTEVNATVQVNLNNLGPQSTGAVTNLTFVAGDANYTYDVTSLFVDYEGDTLTFSTNTTQISSLSCVEFNGTDFKINPSLWSTSCSSFQLNATATDGSSNSLTLTFDVNITNQAPQVLSSPSNLIVYDNISFTHSLDMTNFFKDDDAAHTLLYSVTNVPSFANYTNSSNIITFEGNVTSTVDINQTFSINITATDSYESASISFVIQVLENHQPVTPSSSYTFNLFEGDQGSETINAFTDTESDTITYTCVIENTTDDCSTKSWLDFDTTTLVLTYNITGTTDSNVVLTLEGSDPYNDPVTVTITISIDYIPYVNSTVRPLISTFIVQEQSTFDIDGTLFIDESTSSLTFAATYTNDSVLPSWLTFTPPTSPPSGVFSFSGTYPTYNNDELDIKITATDVNGQVGSQNITIYIDANCHSSCLECYGKDIDQCSSCYSGRFLYLSTCTVVCPSGYYGDSSTNQCLQCDSACKTCTASTSSDCTECFSNSTVTYYESSGDCVLTCPSGYYGNSQSGTCIACHYSCTECYGSSNTECTACDTQNMYVYAYPDTCQIHECPEGTYFNDTTKNCEFCDSSCKNCDGSSATDCTECPNTIFLTSNNTCNSCSQINQGYKYSDVTDSCIEICGKGYRLDQLECDDGNTINLDGCDENCNVETDWACSGGSEINKDTCVSLIGPRCIISTINTTTHNVYLACDETVRFNSKTDGDISLSIDGPLTNYRLKYTIDESTGYVVGGTDREFYIKVEFLTNLYGESTETLNVRFINRQIIEDLDGNDLQTILTKVKIPFYFIALSDQERADANNQSNLSLASLFLTFGTSFLISLVLGSAVEATWQLLGTLQLMSFLPLLNMFLPSNFREFAKNLAVLNGEPEAIPNIFESYYETLDINKEPYNRYFYLMSFKTQYLLLNAGRKVEIWFGIIVISFMSWMMLDLCKYSHKFMGKALTKLDIKMRYSFIIRAVSTSYVSMVLSTTLNMYTITWVGENISVMSNIIAMISACVMLYIPVIAFTIIYRTPDLKDPNFQKRYKTFIIDLKLDNPLCFQFIVVFLFRRALFSSAFVIISELPSIQLAFIIATVVFMTTYLVLVRPYKSVLSLLLSLINEILLLCMLVICIRFLNRVISPETSSQIGTTLISILIFTIGINWLCIIIFGVFSCIKKRMKKKKSKRKDTIVKILKSGTSTNKKASDSNLDDSSRKINQA